LATKSDFTAAEWAALTKGVMGAGMLVSLSDRDLSDSFGEVGALAKYLAGQQVASTSELVRELAKTHGTGFGITSSPEKIRAETIEALQASLATLMAKAPDELEPYRGFVLGVAQAVAEAKGGVVPVETATIDALRGALAEN
jgi:hypothetical protein